MPSRFIMMVIYFSVLRLEPRVLLELPAGERKTLWMCWLARKQTLTTNLFAFSGYFSWQTAYEEMKETKAAVLTLFKVISKSMIDHAPTMGAEYASRTKVKGKKT